MHQNIKATIHVSGLMLHQLELLFAGSTQENPNATLKPASVFQRIKARKWRENVEDSKGLTILLTFNLHKKFKILY